MSAPCENTRSASGPDGAKLNRKRRLFAAVIVIVLIAIGGEVLIESIAADSLLQFVESRLSAETDLEVRFASRATPAPLLVR